MADDPVFGMEPEQYVQHEVDLRLTVKLVAHPEVFNGATEPGGERNCYGLNGIEEAIAHLLFNLLQGRRIDQLDGWADLPTCAAFVETLADLEIYDHSTSAVPEWLQGSIKYDLDRAKERAQRANAEPEPGACSDPTCLVLHADPANPIHPPTADRRSES